MFLAFSRQHPAFGRSFGRYLNRGQRAAVDMKSDMTAYQTVPDMIRTVDPGISYPEYPMGHGTPQAVLIRDSKHNLERLRTSGVAKRQNEQRYTRGRLFSHFKLEEIR